MKTVPDKLLRDCFSLVLSIEPAQSLRFLPDSSGILCRSDFPNSYGTPYDVRGVHDMITRAGVRAGIPYRISPHWLQHTFANFALAGGVNIVDVHKALGHEDIHTTQVYSHSLNDEYGVGPSERIKI